MGFRAKSGVDGVKWVIAFRLLKLLTHLLCYKKSNNMILLYIQKKKTKSITRISDFIIDSPFLVSVTQETVSDCFMVYN